MYKANDTTAAVCTLLHPLLLDTFVSYLIVATATCLGQYTFRFTNIKCLLLVIVVVVALSVLLQPPRFHQSLFIIPGTFPDEVVQIMTLLEDAFGSQSQLR